MTKDKVWVVVVQPVLIAGAPPTGRPTPQAGLKG